MLTLIRFYEDLDKKVFPQWSFVTPNLNHNGHNTDVTVSCAWTRGFVEPLLSNRYFNDNTLVYITWQADGSNELDRSHVAGIILGDAVPREYIGTVDDGYYNHYSDLSTVEANWNLHHLGRWDVGANVWKVVGRKTGDKTRYWNEEIAGGTFESYYWNQSYGGVFSSDYNTTHTYVAPNVDLVRNGRTILPKIRELWGRSPPDSDWGWDLQDNRWPDGDDTGDEYKRVGSGGRGPGAHGPEDYGHGNNKGWWDGGVWIPKGWWNGIWYPKSGHGDGKGHLPDYYRDIIELPDGLHPPYGFEVEIPEAPPMAITTPITAYPYETEALRPSATEM